MKRRDLVSLLQKNGWRLKREGANHEVYEKDNQCEMLPRHNEIAENLAKAIIKRRNLK